MAHHSSEAGIAPEVVRCEERHAERHMVLAVVAGSLAELDMADVEEGSPAGEDSPAEAVGTLAVGAEGSQLEEGIVDSASEVVDRTEVVRGGKVNGLEADIDSAVDTDCTAAVAPLYTFVSAFRKSWKCVQYEGSGVMGTYD